MKRARKSNRVSWASNLCQIKLFSPDDYPSKVGQKSQDGLSNISQIKWKCPPRFGFSSHWRMATGEESTEKEHQKQREMRVLEAFYPRLSSIPLSPFVSLDVEEEDYDDNITPLIPTSNGMPTALNTQPQHDTVMASRVKRAASLGSSSSCEFSSVPLPSPRGNLNNVVNQVQTTGSTMPCQPSTGSACATKDANYHKNLIRQHGADKHDSQMDIRHSNFQDLNSVPNIKHGEVKRKIQKPCRYFKSSKGCRNGSNCRYQHDGSIQWGAGTGTQNAKE